MGSGEDAQFVFAKYDYTAQGNQELDMRRYEKANNTLIGIN